MQFIAAMKLVGSRTILLVLLACHIGIAQAVGTSAESTHGSDVRVHGQLPPIGAGMYELKFGDIYKFPVGSRGLEPTDKLASLNNQSVRMVGYMVKQDIATDGQFILAAVPVELGDEDETYADDLPANAVFVHLEDASQKIAFIPGVLSLSGILELGNQEEPDGRISYARLRLDPALSHNFVVQQQAVKE